MHPVFQPEICFQRLVEIDSAGSIDRIVTLVPIDIDRVVSFPWIATDSRAQSALKLTDCPK